MSSTVNHQLRTTPLARALTTARLKAGRRHVDAARICGVGATMIANAEAGVSLLGRDHLPALATYYGCSVEPLLRAHDLSVSSFKLRNRLDEPDDLRAEVGLALQIAWEELGPEALRSILALLPELPPLAVAHRPGWRRIP